MHPLWKIFRKYILYFSHNIRSIYGATHLINILMTTTNQETNYKKTTANDGGQTSPTSCRQEYLFTVVTEADVELERPGTNYKDNGKR